MYNQLKKLKRESGHTYKEIEALTGIPTRTLQYWSKGNFIPTDARMKLAQLFCCSVEAIMKPLEGDSSMDQTRRTFLQALTVASSTFFLPDFTSLQPHLSQIDVSMINDLADINKRYWSLYLASPSKPYVLSAVQGHLQLLTQFLQNSTSTGMKKRISGLASEVAQLAGEIFFDLNDHYSAIACYTFAANAAQEACQYDLWACALVRHAFVPLYDKRYHDALPLLQNAEQIASHGDSELPTKQWVAGVISEVHSGLSNLSQTQKTLDIAATVEEKKTTTPSWIRFDSARIPAMQGACYTRLNNPTLAEPSLQKALHQFNLPGRKRGMVLIDLAQSAMQREDVEAACEYAGQVVDIMSIGSSDFLRKGVKGLQSQLKPYAKEYVVSHFNQRVAALV